MLAFLFSIAFLYPYTNATGLSKDSCTSIIYNDIYKAISTCSSSTSSDFYKVLPTSFVNVFTKDLPASSQSHDAERNAHLHFFKGARVTIFTKGYVTADAFGASFIRAGLHRKQLLADGNASCLRSCTLI